VLADIFQFRKVKEVLAGLHLTQESLKNAWQGVMRTITKDEFAIAFRPWFQQCKKCIGSAVTTSRIIKK
jgi:hypothetical protein